MNPRTYNLITGICMGVAVIAAVAADRVPSATIVAIAVAFAAGVVTILTHVVSNLITRRRESARTRVSSQRLGREGRRDTGSLRACRADALMQHAYMGVTATDLSGELERRVLRVYCSELDFRSPRSRYVALVGYTSPHSPEALIVRHSTGVARSAHRRKTTGRSSHRLSAFQYA